LAVAGLASRGEVFSALAAVTLATLLVPEGGVSQRTLRVASTMLLGVVSIYLVLETEVSTRYSVERLEGDANVRYFASSTMLSVFGATPESWFRGLGTNYSTMLLGIYPHNQPVQALTEGGILGACLWLSVHGFALRAYLRARPQCTSDSSRVVLRVATALWVYFVVIGLKRGHVLDVWAISSAVVLERCALVLTELRAASVTSFAPPAPSRRPSGVTRVETRA
jgi:O-antigen ligase